MTRSGSRFLILQVTFTFSGLFQGAITTPLVALIALTAATPALAEAQAQQECTLPICDLDAALSQLRAQGSNGRYQTLEAYRAQLPTLTEPAAIEVLAQFGLRATQLLTDLQEEGWVIRAAQALSATALKALLLTPGVPTADLIRYFTLLNDSETRYRTLSVWLTRLNAIEAPTLQTLADYHRLFRHAVESTTQNEDYVIGIAKGGLSTISGKILLGFFESITETQAKNLFTHITDTQLKRDIPNTLATRVEQQGQTYSNALLLRMRTTAIYLLELYQNDPDWVQASVRSWLSEVSQRLFFSPDTTPATQVLYFSDLGTSKRYALLLRFEAELGQKTTRAAIDTGVNTLKEMLAILRDNERSGSNGGPDGSDAYVERQLRSTLSTSSIRLIQHYQLNEVEIRQAVSQITGEGNFSTLATAFNLVATPLEAANPYLDTLFVALQNVIADLVARFGQEPSRLWIINAIKDPLAAVSLKLLDREGLSAGQITLYTSGIRNPDKRRAVISMFKQRALLPRATQAHVELYHTVFDSVVELCERQEDPEWIIREAKAAREDVARRLLVEWEITGELAKHLVLDVSNLEPRRVLLVELGTKASEWNGSTPEITRSYLESLYDLMEFTVIDSRSPRYARDRWIENTAQGTWDLVSMRLLKDPVANADRMIRFFRNMRSNQRRNEIITYWRNKSARGYDDRNSILQLARFFYLATVAIDQTGGADWLKTNASSGEQDINEKASIMYPIYEGSYRVSSSEMPALGHVQIMNTIGGDGLVVQLSGTDRGRSLYQFLHTTISRGLSRIESTTNERGLLSRLVITLNPFTGAISGTIENSDTRGKIEFRGQQARSSGPIYEDQLNYLRGQSQPRLSIPSTQELDGVYEGQFGDRRVRFTISTIGVQGPRVEPILYLTASLRVEGQTTPPVLFGNGRFNSRTGMLLLSAHLPNSSRVKITLGTRKAGGRLNLIGATHNSFGESETSVSLSRVLP